MQKDHPLTSKRPNRRIGSAGTPECPKSNNVDAPGTSIRAKSSRHRATMAPTDFASSHSTKDFLPRRRLVKDRMSLLPSQLPLEGSRLGSTKTADVDTHDTELKQLYDEYLWAMMSEIIVKKKIEEKKNAIMVDLATLGKEMDHDREKLFKLQKRERDIMAYTIMQNEIDTQLVEIDKFKKNEVTKTVYQLLSQLYSCLKPLDVLHCKNIVLPNTPQEWKELEKAVKACTNTIEAIAKLIGSKGDTYKETYSSIQEFIKGHSELENQLKAIEKPLWALQALTLKTVSLSLTEEEKEEKDDDDIKEDIINAQI